MKKRSQPGFTVLELTFAIVVIGIMMAIVLSTIVGMLRFYNFASVIRINQAAGRQVMDDITRQIRFSTIIEPKTTDPNDKTALCAADTKNQKLLSYRYDAPTQSVIKTTMSYGGTAIPANCDPHGSSIISVDNTSTITPATMHVTGIKFTRTAGARISANPNITAIIVDLSFINGTAGPGGVCRNGDIYCSQLHFNTAVNIRGGGQ